MVNLENLKKIVRIFIIISILSFSCNNLTDEIKKENPSKKKIDYTELNFDSVHVIINSNYTEEWTNYNELEEYIIQFSQKDYSSVIDNKKYLITFFNRLKNSIPESIDKPEIKSRLTVIETDFLKFESIVSNYDVDKKNIASMVKRINNSFSNLNFQIDKLIEKQQIITAQ